MLLLACSALTAMAGKIPDGFSEHYADVNGTRIHYFIGGTGNPVVLLHGYAETSHMWLPIMPLLAKNHTVIVPDLRGAGDSAKPDSGYDKKNMAVDIHDLVTSLGFNHAEIVGHDIGLMVAYAYAAQFPKETDRLVLMDAFLPGIGDWKKIWLSATWHFHFYGDVPLALVKGRERIYFEHFWNDFAADPQHSIPEADRRLYAKTYAQPGGMRAGYPICPWGADGEAENLKLRHMSGSANIYRQPCLRPGGHQPPGPAIGRPQIFVAHGSRSSRRFFSIRSPVWATNAGPHQASRGKNVSTRRAHATFPSSARAAAISMAMAFRYSTIASL